MAHLFPSRSPPPSSSHLFSLSHSETIIRDLLHHTTPVYTRPPPALSSSSSPSHLQPSLPPARLSRKLHQHDFLLSLISHLPRPRRLLDLCCGTGAFGLVLANAYPSLPVILLDRSSHALSVAHDRAVAANLHNIQIIQGDVSADVDVRSGDCVFALHACGGATDAVLARAMEVGASVVVVSCCMGGAVGKGGGVTGRGSGSVVRGVGGGVLEWGKGRSVRMREAKEWERVVRVADYGEKGQEWRKAAKALVEWDRVLWLRDCGFQARLLKIRGGGWKNDVVVGWKGEGVEWQVDAEMEQLFWRVREGGLGGLGEAEVRETRIQMVEEMEKGGIFTGGKGRRGRKVVHAVAESLGMWHESQGKGARRTVVVKRSRFWPVFFEGYVGVGGKELEMVCEELEKWVPTEFVQRRRESRGNERHITVIRPGEVGRAIGNGGREELMSFVEERLRGSDVRVLGVGRVEENRGGIVNESWFGVLEWEVAQMMRAELGLEMAGIHVTLGFADRDIHTKFKGRRTIIKEIDLTFKPWGKDG